MKLILEELISSLHSISWSYCIVRYSWKSCICHISSYFYRCL